MKRPMIPIPSGHIIPPYLLRLVKMKKTKTEVSQTLSLMEHQMLNDVKTLIQCGLPITNAELEIFCEEQSVDFVELQRCINGASLNVGNINQSQIMHIQRNYLSSTGVQLSTTLIEFVASKCLLRTHLDRLNVPYFDYENNSLVKVERLISAERTTDNAHFQQNGNIPPLAPVRLYCGESGMNIFEIMFPELYGGRGYNAMDFDEWGDEWGDDLGFEQVEEEEEIEGNSSTAESDHETNDEEQQTDGNSSGIESEDKADDEEENNEENDDESDNGTDAEEHLSSSESEEENRNDANRFEPNEIIDDQDEEEQLSSDSSDFGSPAKRPKLLAILKRKRSNMSTSSDSDTD